MSGIRATNRTINSIRKSDAAPRNMVNGIPGNISVPSTARKAGTTAYWAKVTAITDANNYTADIYNLSDLAAKIDEDQAVYVPFIGEALAVDSYIPVQSSDITDVDYECTQQLGMLEKD